MFTGIVESTGRVRSLRMGTDLASLVIGGPGWIPELAVGDSVAVNGVCLTVTTRDEASFSVEAVPETLRRTNLGELKPDDRVNLERALRPTDRLNGHLVTGHVDGVGTLVSIAVEGDARWLTIAAPADVMSHVVAKGSIAVDGVSLTVVDYDAGRFRVTIIPHTWRITNLSDRRPGARLNLEADVVGKYLQRFLKPYVDTSAGGPYRGQQPSP